MTNRRQPRQNQFKGLLWDWDAISAQTDDECCYSLTNQERDMLLATVEYIGWITRWISPTDTAIDQTTITRWSADLARKLMSGCCPDEVILHRVTEDGALEISTDGGTTWIPDPNDPRTTGTTLPNTIPGSGDTKKCNAATNALEKFQDAKAAFATGLGTATTIVGFALEIAGAVILMLLSAGTTAEILVPIVISAATALFGVLEADYNAEFTSDVWDTLLCDLFCTIGPDGQFTTSQYNDLQAKIDTDFAGSDHIIQTFQSILRGWGTLGLNNACISGAAATADCSSCDCGTACGEDMQPYSTPDYGTFVGIADGVVTYTIGTTHYLIVGNFTPGTCCYVNDISLTGDASICCFQPCPGEYSDPSYIFATPVGQCCQWLQIQGSPGTTVTVTYSPCP